MQRVCENDGKASSTKTIKVVELAREGAEEKCKSAKLCERNTDKKVELVKDQAIKKTVCEKFVRAE